MMETSRRVRPRRWRSEVIQRIFLIYPGGTLTRVGDTKVVMTSIPQRAFSGNDIFQSFDVHTA